jgi:hypothetical protein
MVIRKLKRRWAYACLTGLALAVPALADDKTAAEPSATSAGSDPAPASASPLKLLPSDVLAQPAADEPAKPDARRPVPAYRRQTLGQNPLPSSSIGSLRRPVESTPPPPEPPPTVYPDGQALIVSPIDPPTGYAGPSGVAPSDLQDDSHFIPIEDRWRIGFPEWDRYDKGHPFLDDYPFDPGSLWNPYKQNWLKGDYPIYGQNTFLNVTASLLSVTDAREVPTPTRPFESTVNPFQEQFFGKPSQLSTSNYVSLSFDLFHGDAAFKPIDWRIQLTPVFNFNTLNLNELGIVNTNDFKGTSRDRTFTTLEEWFLETKLFDIGPNYDFVSLRAGSQFFNADFRGFLFVDTNRAVRLFGTLHENREQFNLIYFNQQEKDTNSELNDLFHSRDQQIGIANYYYQDFIWPGYTAMVNAAYNHDDPTFHFNKNNFLVRPDPVGTFTPHTLDVVYLGWAGDGHINRFNITHQFYWALGHDSFNPMANQPQEINAQFFACELSYDRDYVRFRTSFLWASGDHQINNRHATGFDSIMDNPNFAGGQFSYFDRQAIGLFGVNLTNGLSLLPDLRSSKIQGQSNFVNPGLYLLNFGVDVDLTPKWKMINNINFLWFDDTDVLQQFVFQKPIDTYIGIDLSTGLEYRPFLSNNVIVTTGLSCLIPGEGFDDLYDNWKFGPVSSNPHPLLAGFLVVNLNF